MMAVIFGGYKGQKASESISYALDEACQSAESQKSPGGI